MKQKQEIVCSFCGRDKSQANVLIAGINGHICDQCVTQAQSIIGDEQDQKLKSNIGTPLTLPKPAEIKKFLDEKTTISIIECCLKLPFCPSKG